MISIIVAKAKNGVIGKEGVLPWDIPLDLKHFAQITKGHTVVMGRKTYESIIQRLGHALPNRKNIVITSQTAFSASDCTVMHSVEGAIKQFSGGGEEVFVIGGSEIYKQFLPVTGKLYITEISLECAGDAFFPDYTASDWELVSTELHHKFDGNPCDFAFLELVRK